MVAYNYYVDYYPSFPLGLSGPVVPPKVQSIASVAAAGAATTGTMLAAFAGMSAAGPIGVAVAAAIGIGIAIANMFGGCGQTCIQAANDANQAADLLQKNLDAWFAIPPSQRYKSIQAAYLNNVMTLFNALQQACSDPALGDAGKRCISERLTRGSTAPWCPNPGHTGCDWWVLFYDPIANDPNVIPDPPASMLSSTTSSLLSPSNFPSGFPLIPLLILAVGGVVLMGMD